jgi:cytoskeletal protein RodZ
MATVAQQLQGAREALGLTVYQVAETTKIKTDHIRALEKGDYNCFAAPVYIRGFVRTYSSILKLNPDEVIKSLDQELAQTDKFSEPPSLGPQSDGFLDVIMFQLSKINWWVALILIGLAAIFFGGLWGYRSWQVYRSRDPLHNLGPGMYQAPVPTKKTTLPPPTQNTPTNKPAKR